MVWLLIAVITVIFLFFPLQTDINIFVDIMDKKLYYGAFMFAFIKVYGGFVKIDISGLKISLTDANNIKLYFADLLKKRLSLIYLNGFKLKRFSLIAEQGSKEMPIASVFGTSILNGVAAAAFGILKQNGKKLKLTCDSLLFEDDDVFKLSGILVFSFNMFTVLLTLLSIPVHLIFGGAK